MKNLKLDNQGFSLIEIMVVVGIMGILTLIGYPAYNGYRASATRSVASTNSKNIASAYKVCRASGGSCENFESIQMGDLDGQVANNRGADGICFGLEQKTGNETVKSCVSIKDTGKTVHTLGWYDTSNPQTNNNPQNICFCQDGNTTPILVGSVKICTADADCPNSVCTGTATGKCMSQQGTCQTTGGCL